MYSYVSPHGRQVKFSPAGKFWDAEGGSMPRMAEGVGVANSQCLRAAPSAVDVLLLCRLWGGPSGTERDPAVGRWPGHMDGSLTVSAMGAI